MPVTVYPSAHGAEPYRNARFERVSSQESLLHATLLDDTKQRSSSAKALVKSSFAGLSPQDDFRAAKNGFVHACLESYNYHQHLVIRPEDVWFAILTQLSVYVNAHAEELRSVFVSHSGRKDLEILDDSLPPDISQWDHGQFAYEMTKLMEANLKDPAWREWILPAFSTTMKTDQAAASVVFMGTLQKYFTYTWGTRCGIPSVTMLGEVEDWIKIRDRCSSRLGTLGKETEAWLRVLRPVLDGFVESFRKPEGHRAVDFWRRIVSAHIPNRSGSTTYSGWITAFCYWDEKANCLHKSNFTEGEVRITYSDIPVGFTKVPVTLLLFGVKIPTEMVAGSMGFSVGDSEKPNGSTSRIGLKDTIQPEIGWIMYRT